MPPNREWLLRSSEATIGNISQFGRSVRFPKERSRKAIGNRQPEPLSQLSMPADYSPPCMPVYMRPREFAPFSLMHCVVPSPALISTCLSASLLCLSEQHSFSSSMLSTKGRSPSASVIRSITFHESFESAAIVPKCQRSPKGIKSQHQ
jgi:hypothetical protein